MESIRHIRNVLKKGRKYRFNSGAEFYEAMDEAIEGIEREIAERYMELPTDADGVPIHVGDELCGYGLPNGGAVVKALNGVMVIVGGLDGGENYAKSGLLWDARETHHIKPRTIENVLYECFHDCMYKHPFGIEPIISKYAADIRELMGVRE